MDQQSTLDKRRRTRLVSYRVAALLLSLLVVNSGVHAESDLSTVSDLGPSEPGWTKGSQLANVTQRGDLNNAQLDQYGENAVNVMQDGVGQVAIVSQRGNLNWASVAQAGTGNRFDVTQAGEANLVMSSQNGSSNQVSVTQAGANNGVRSTQVGNSNTLTVSQLGANHTVAVTQIGNGAAAVIVQH